MHSLIPDIEQLMRDVGEYLVQAQHEVEVSWKGAGETDPVTNADRESERRLREGLGAILPEAEFRGEESSWSRWEGLAWVVDPIDGTSAFIAKRDVWSILVALVENKTPVIGCAYFPVTGEFYHAVKGRGAFKNGEPIHVSEHDRIRGARTHASSEGVSIINRAGAHETLYCRGAGRAFTLVAEGKLDAYAHITGKYRIKEWDVAAGILLVEEAGGRASTFANNFIQLNKKVPEVADCVFSNGLLHDEILALYDDPFEQDL